MKKEVCENLQLNRNVVYYRNKDDKPGRKATTTTIFNNELVSEEKVLISVKNLLDHEFLCYGYLKISKQLKLMAL